MEPTTQEKLLYGNLNSRVRGMLEPVVHDSFLFFDDTVRLLEPELASGADVFHAGCGRGAITAWLSQKGCRVLAVDSSEERLNQARRLLSDKQLLKNVTLRTCSLPDQFPQERFDVILDCFTWWQISDWSRLFNLSHKGLKPGGKLIILDTFFGWSTSIEMRQQMRELWQAALPTYNECRNMLTKREFRLARIQPLQDVYRRYVEAMFEKATELRREGLRGADPKELSELISLWDWFRKAAEKEELVATMIVAELTA